MHTSYESSMHMHSIHTMDTLGDVYYVFELVVLYSTSMDNSMHVCILYA